MNLYGPENRVRTIAEVRKGALEHKQRYGRFPKTLIFAVNDLLHTSHADQLVDICRDTFGHGDAFVEKLSTGVDIPNLEFIVLLRVPSDERR